MRESKRRNRVTPEGHAKHVEVALRNFSGMKVGQAAKASIRTEVDEFKRELLASADVAAHPGRRVLVYSAAASLAALRVIVQRLSAANLTKDEFHIATESLPTLQSALLRTLNVLGVTAPDTNEDQNEPPRGGIADYLERKARERAVNAAPIEADNAGHP